MNTWPWMESDVGEQPVLAVQQRRPGLVQHLWPAALRQDQPGAGKDAQDHHDGGGQQPLEQVQPVRQESERAPPFGFPDERECEQEGGDQQENVHAAGYPAQPHMVGNHHQHGERPEPLDLGPEGRLPALGRFPCCVGGSVYCHRGSH
jgi:hypothetical protein